MAISAVSEPRFPSCAMASGPLARQEIAAANDHLPWRC
jgi:hypothetical protein